MSDDYTRMPEDHYTALYRLRAGLLEADGLKMFLIAVAQSASEFDAVDSCTTPENPFLNHLDRILERLYENPENTVAAVEAAKTLRGVLEMHLDEIRMFRRPAQ